MRLGSGDGVHDGGVRIRERLGGLCHCLRAAPGGGSAAWRRPAPLPPPTNNSLPACREELRQRFPGKPWVDVLSKADLLEEELDEADRLLAQQRQQQAAAAGQGQAAQQQAAHTAPSAVQFAVALPGALRVSSMSGAGVDALKGAMLRMLEEHDLQQQQQQQGDMADAAQGGGATAAAAAGCGGGSAAATEWQ